MEPCSLCLYCFCPRRTGKTWSKATAASCCQNRSIGSRLFVESPMSMWFFASCIFRPLLKWSTSQFLGYIPKPGRRGGVARPSHDQRASRSAAQFTNSSGAVIGARFCLRARRCVQDRPCAICRRLAKEWSGKIGREREHPTRAAREQVGSGKSRMGRVADKVPASRVAAPLQFKREHQTG